HAAQLGIRLHRGHHLPAILVRKQKVEQHERRSRSGAVEERHRLLAVRRAHGGEAGALELFADRLAQLLLVLDDEDGRLHPYLLARFPLRGQPAIVDWCTNASTAGPSRSTSAHIS